MTISKVEVQDARFKLEGGDGADAIHCDPTYAYAVTRLHTNTRSSGTGLAFTLGGGNDVVCSLAAQLAEPLLGRDIEEVMAEFGRVQRAMADHPRLRWLGPHKGAVHLALASVTNACFDLWAKSRGVPLWKLLLSLSASELVRLLDLSYVEDVLPTSEATAIIESHRATRPTRESVLREGYPGYDTSVGWFNYSDEEISRNVKRALDAGFTAMKLKVGSADSSRDVRRARLVREVAGPAARIMLDANQQWSLPVALRVCLELAEMDPYWIEEPTHPDDVMAHQTLQRAIAPIRLAIGEHIPNRVVFKNYMRLGTAEFIQVDAVRVAGVSEFIVVSMLARKYGLKVVPHVGDMGQLHQHLVLFNHIALGLDKVFLEHIPHLRNRFVHPAAVVGGVYRTPMEPGSSCDLH
jgi:L-fuconate dehydratase